MSYVWPMLFEDGDRLDAAAGERDEPVVDVVGDEAREMLGPV